MNIKTGPDGQVTVDGEPLDSLLTDREGEPPASPYFAQRLETAAIVAHAVTLMQKARANTGFQFAALSEYIYALAQATAPDAWQLVLSHYQIPSGSQPISIASIRGWSCLAHAIEIPFYEAELQLIIGHVKSLAHDISPFASILSEYSEESRNAVLNRLLEFLTPNQQNNLAHLRYDLRRPYEAPDTLNQPE